MPKTYVDLQPGQFLAVAPGSKLSVTSVKRAFTIKTGIQFKFDRNTPGMSKEVSAAIDTLNNYILDTFYYDNGQPRKGEHIGVELPTSGANK